MRRSGPRKGRAGGLPPAALLAATLASCALEYPQPQGAEGEKPPTARFTGYSHTVVIRGEKAFELTAEKAEVYSGEHRTVLTGVGFTEYDPDTGELVSSGKADTAIFHDDTEDAEFSGSVFLQSKRQDAKLDSEYLSWNSKEKRLEGRLDRTVTISRGDGSRVSGAGFAADARNRSFSFKEGVEGTVVDEPKAEAGKAPGSENDAAMSLGSSEPPGVPEPAAPVAPAEPERAAETATPAAGPSQPAAGPSQPAAGPSQPATGPSQPAAGPAASGGRAGE